MEKLNKRPALLSALCILTFIGSTTAFLGWFTSSVLFDKVSHIIIKYSSWHSTDAISPLYFTLLMALHAVSLTGAIRMWKLHRDGYFLYIFSQLFILFIPVLWINFQSLSITNAIFTVVFIVGYTINFKYLRPGR